MRRKNIISSFVLRLLTPLIAAFLFAAVIFVQIGLAKSIPGCQFPGWFPGEFGLKDHAIFWHAGYYYLVSTYVPKGDPSPILQDRFVYARSADLCSWEELTPILFERVQGSWDEAAVWAPY